MEAYCVKCKTKREMETPQAVFTASAVPATKGTCPVCGTTLYRMGGTEAHAGVPRPEPAASANGHRTERASRKPGKAAKRQASAGVRRKGRLVIVESPAKAKTVGRFLGKGYQVRASVGHIRDLLRSQLSVDVENDFAPKYRVPNEKRDVVNGLKAEAARAEQVFLATDPDREGEAISWHLTQAAGIEPERAQRVVFHEITQSAIDQAFAHPRAINMDLVNAQQARRILDRLVGYKLSPLLWAKVRGRLSAGRVQSVAVRLIVDREREIQAFVPEEYWSIEAELARKGERSDAAAFVAKLIRAGDREIELRSEGDVQPLLAHLERAAYTVAKVKRSERRRNPAAPFTTSTLQQEASRRMSYTAKRTMSVAQQLYEGIDLGTGGAVGLITYMRTDSTNVSDAAQAEARQFIADKFGPEYLPPAPPQYKTKSKGAQEAHEAIRPTEKMPEPKAIESFLSRDQLRLYTLIWQRFVASQMAAAIYDTVSVDIEARVETPAGSNGDSAPPVYFFRAAGSAIRFPGFLAVYEEAREEDAAGEEEGRRLPPLADGDPLDLRRLLPLQHFTQPPPRYSEATLVKALEEYGIGRPSTYAPILSTIQQRGYVVRVDKRLEPTETGIVVNDLLVEHFPNIVDPGFTATMEEELDQIAEGERAWTPVLHKFYGPFAEQVTAAEAAMPVVNSGPEYVGRACPESGHALIIRWGRYGKFVGCSDFPKCRYTEPWLEKIGVLCPKDGGEIVERKTRKSRVFYGCANYPNCDFTAWKKPLAQPCPNCGGLLTGASKQFAQCVACGQKTPLDTLAPLPTETSQSA